VSYSFDFDPTHAILRCRFDGAVSDQTLREFFPAARQYVAKTAPRAGIVDFSAVTSFEVNADTVRELAKLPPVLPEQRYPCFIVAESPPIFGMMRMFELVGLDARPNLHVVRSLKEVYAILGVPEFKFEPVTA
jgi:hypothetical protein